MTTDVARDVRQVRGPGDQLFRGALRSGGIIVLLIMLSVGAFLLFRAAEAFDIMGWRFLTTADWSPGRTRADPSNFGVLAMLTGTVLIALVALVVAVPLATGTALYISEYTSPRLQRTLISVVDLMAAVPSIIYGLWGAFMFTGQVVPVARWISTYLGWIPLLAVPEADLDDPLSPEVVYTSSSFIAGIVVAMMVAPIVCSIMREVFSQAPAGEREAAYALGATRWGMIRSVVLPFGRGGMIGGTMLGLGRALGETIAVYMTISIVFRVQPHILQVGSGSVSAMIAQRFGAEGPLGISALFAAGLVLFVMTLIVNFLASIIVARSRSGASSEV